MQFYFFSDDYPDYEERLQAMSGQAMAWEDYCTLQLMPKG